MIGALYKYWYNVFLIVLSGYSVFGSMNPYIYPPGEEIVINTGENITLKCFGTKPVLWSNRTTYSTESKSYDGRHYTATLQINYAEFFDTGYYVCNMSDSHGAVYHSRIYLYVRDPEHLLVHEDFLQLYGEQYGTVVFPCRPTAPDITVTLTKDGEEIPKEELTFNSKIGFYFYIASLYADGFYSCTASGNGNEQSFDMKLDVGHKSHSDSVPKPYLNISDETHLEEGGNITILCTVDMQPGTMFDMKFFYPAKKQGRLEIGHIKETTAEQGNIVNVNSEMKKEGRKSLIITNITKEDSGSYVCEVEDHKKNVNSNEKLIFVHPANSSYLNVTAQGKLDYVIDAMGNARFVVYIQAHPWPHVEWFGPEGVIVNGSRHLVFTESSQTYLSITDIRIQDTGNYSVKVENNNGTVWINYTLTVRDGPLVEIDSNDIKNYYMVDELHTVKCKVAGYPEPEVRWFFRECVNFSNCEHSVYDEINKSNISAGWENIFLMSTVHMTAVKTGQLVCWAKNTISAANDTINFIVTDVLNGVGIYGESTYVEGDTMSILCGASVTNYTGPFIWRKIIEENRSINYQNITNSEEYEISDSRTPFSTRTTLTIRDIRKEHAGKYECNFMNLETRDETYENIEIKVKDLQKPMIIKTNMKGDEKYITTPDPVVLDCLATGVPEPTIIWIKNDDRVEPSNRTLLTNGNQTLKIISSHMKDDGTYRCIVSNRGGSVERVTKLKITDKPDLDKGLVATIVILIILVAVSSIFACIKIRKERKLMKEMEVAGLKNFEEGAMESLNPDLPVDEQAELLPYDKKFEFPRDKLKLGKQLGAGAFGVVMKADAWGIVEGEPVTTVAVKMVKKTADFTVIKALVSELKIMTHLGRHLNVVNLLGACTKCISKRELLVIVEFCRFGNLHNYLIRHRDNFINQINPKTDEIDPCIGADILTRATSVGGKSRVKYAALSFSSHSGENRSDESGVDCRFTPSHESSNRLGSISASDAPMICMTPTGEDSAMLSNNSIQPEWRSNMHGDYKPSHVRPICTRDLLCWAFQVARGMEYLSSRKVLHGDLAARNILLADDNVVKICDFGLAKSMYKSDNYKKKGDGPLPIKWMAIESIRDRVFSTQSDVWSFGIVLWEFFSLARTPYPGMEADEKLYHKLVDGYRMECPKYSTQEIHNMMMDCWQARPNLRPTFTEISEHLGAMLEESVRRHYIDLNDPYIAMNISQLEGHSDYLSMMSAPTYGNLMSPSYDMDGHHYVNEPQPVAASDGENSGYLSMKSPRPADDAVIFSPRAETVTGSIFNFNTTPQQQKKFSNNDVKSAVNPETKPMLLNENDSDTESVNNLNREIPKEMKITNDLKLPKSPTGESPAFFNPSYQEKLSIPSSPDNYVNMQQQKKEALTNKNSYDPASNYLSMVKPSVINGENKNLLNNSGIPNAFANPNYKASINANKEPYVNEIKF